MTTIEGQEKEPVDDSGTSVTTKNGFDLDPVILKYLGLFDNYDKVRTKLSKALSSGFFNLAQANYGRQFRINPADYDQRMQASTLVQYDPSSHQFKTRNDTTHTSKDKDPIRWFGGFPSPSLRQAQFDFQQGFQEILALVDLIQEMKYLEIKIKQEKSALYKSDH